jgi:hypothetical protein
MASQASLRARALLFQRKLAEATVDFSIPGVTELDNQLSVLELGGDQLALASDMAEKPDGKTSKTGAMAASICLTLVMREDKERVFTDTDVDTVEAFGLSVLMPLNSLIEQVSGLSNDALAIAKKSSQTTPDAASSTSLPVNSATPETSSSNA